MNESVLAQIERQLPGLSTAEGKVARLILDQTQAVARCALAEVAKLAHVSEPTVIRFCRSIGYDGWPDFKIKLAASLMVGVPYVHSSLRAGDDTAVLAAKVLDNAVSALLRVRNDINADRLDTAIGLLAGARRIEFYGVGNSGIVAADAQHKFFRFDLSTVAYSDTHTQLMAASLLSPADVLVAISHSGRSKELLDAVRLARANGCPIVAITATNTPLAQMATVLLRADTQEDTDIYSPMISRLVHLALIDVLALGLALKYGNNASKVLEKTKQSLRDRRA
ncbi:transcriptional regulator [Pollutimonas nitritireducens]|uniref:Transcriptional regulator n=1 Tax=Pollutimonas nitritireducens TaxID=2045209 RepID=A0A2N4UJL7_9BURK|nr:SIS domain-containing protein [Pollutimonas nitritireducens]PLC55221.1 transcriptional regulator [Pollutimonas nitritireducens]